MIAILHTLGQWLIGLFNNNLFIAVVAGFTAYYFSLRSQKKLLQEQQKSEVYKAIWEKRDEFAKATIELSVHIRGLDNEFIMLKSIDDTRNTMRGIVDKPDHAYDYDMRQKWGAYCSKVSESGSIVSEAFGKMHSSFEQTFFMYPHLEKAFYLLRDEYELFFNLQFELNRLLYDFDGVDLLSKDVQKKLLDKVEHLGIADKVVELQVYSDDYFRLVQHSLTGKVFDFKFRERVPFIGKILTPDGWKRVEKISENKFDAKMIKLAKQEAEKSMEPIKCGVVLVDKDSQIVAKAYNTQRADNKTANHAEMNAISLANDKLGRKLKGVTAYCSCEPCPMCLTALIFASVNRIVFAKPLSELVERDKQIYVESYNFISRFPNPPQLEWFVEKNN